MNSFLDSMRSALQARLWERSQPAQSSGQSHTSSPGPAFAPGSSSATMDDPLVDSQLVGMLVAMGFPKQRAVRAALETGNTGTPRDHSAVWKELHSAHLTCMLHWSYAG